MGQMISRKCPRCGQVNHYDLDELRRPDAEFWRRKVEGKEEFWTECRFCRYKFVIIVEG